MNDMTAFYDYASSFASASASATNTNGTVLNQSNPTVVVGDDISNVDVTNVQTNSTDQDADAFASADGGYGGWYSGTGGATADATADNSNFSVLTQVNPTIIIGDDISGIDVTNVQTNDTDQNAFASASADGGYDYGHLAAF
jgi:hypothetical protein